MLEQQEPMTFGEVADALIRAGQREHPVAEVAEWWLNNKHRTFPEIHPELPKRTAELASRLQRLGNHLGDTRGSRLQNHGLGIEYKNDNPKHCKVSYTPEEITEGVGDNRIIFEYLIPEWWAEKLSHGVGLDVFMELTIGRHTDEGSDAESLVPNLADLIAIKTIYTKFYLTLDGKAARVVSAPANDPRSSVHDSYDSPNPIKEVLMPFTMNHVPLVDQLVTSLETHVETSGLAFS